MGFCLTVRRSKQSEQWTHKNFSPQKKAKTILSAGNVMLNSFWDYHVIMSVDYLEKGKIISGIGSITPICCNN